MSLKPGMILQDRYQVVRAISSGGMGSIYEGRDTQRQGTRVAIKQLLEHLLEGQQKELFCAKFEAEVEFLRKLNHPGIPKLYDSFVLDSNYYMVMEFVIGRNLEQELEERLQLTGQPMGPQQVMRDAAQVLQILDYLHSQSPPLVHRDIKPANLIREHPTLTIKLVDFGMARFLSEPNQTQTQLGTLGYCPLEQMQGKAEQRSDLYALGATLNHLVTGVAPTALNIQPVLTLKPDCNPELAAFIDRACASELEIRYPNARFMLAALAEISITGPDGSIKLEALPRLDQPKPRLGPPPPLPPDPLPEPDTETEPIPLTLPESPPLEFPHKRPLSRGKSYTWQLTAVLGVSILAFLAGRWVSGSQPSPSASASASPTPVSVAPLPMPTETPVAPVPVTPQAIPTENPTPVAQLPSPRPEPPPPRPAPSATSQPDPSEGPQTYSLSGPQYPVARTATAAHESLTLMDDGRLDVELTEDWNPIARVRGSSYFVRSYRQSAANWELTLDLKGNVAEESLETYRNSFQVRHNGWDAETLEGADLAFHQGRGRSHHVEALILRPGHYYFFGLRGNGMGMSDELFREHLTRAWAGVQVLQ